jgi:hypothetical protein
MNARCIQLGLVLGCCLLWACDPDDACDKGYYADHGYCYVTDAQTDLMVVDGSADGDGGVPEQDPNAKFGKPCSLQSDCGGIAPVCGGPMLPVCTDINCMESGRDTCPTGWLCVDVTKYSPAPGVVSACISF